MTQQRVLSRDECHIHDFMWLSGGGMPCRHTYTCKRCGYCHDGNGHELPSLLTCLTGPNGVYRAWWPDIEAIKELA